MMARRKPKGSQKRKKRMKFGSEGVGPIMKYAAPKEKRGPSMRIRMMMKMRWIFHEEPIGFTRVLFDDFFLYICICTPP